MTSAGLSRVARVSACTAAIARTLPTCNAAIPDRVIEVQWSDAAGRAARDGQQPVYPVDVGVEALDRQGLLRDISEVFAREKMNVIGVQSQTVKGVAWMTFTIELTDARHVARAMSVVGDVGGVRICSKKMKAAGQNSEKC